MAGILGGDSQRALNHRGDCNIEPTEAGHHWGRRQARLLDVGAATQEHGRNIDCVLASLRTPTWGAEGVVVPGTDHVGVQVKIEAVYANTLRTKMESPVQIPLDAMDIAQGETRWQTIEATLGEPPTEWEIVDERGRRRTVKQLRAHRTKRR